MKYKKSRYNFFVPYKNGETIVFNGFSGSIGKFDEENMRRYETDTFDEHIMEKLTDKGIYVSEEFDEVAKIAEDRSDGISDSTKKCFRIWTTSACNARCYYCYEKGIEAISMDTDTADAVVKYMESALNPGDNLYLEWFGGEPLLNHAIISYIMDKVKKICSYKNCKIFGKMITNGSLVTKEIAEKMKNDWMISFVQITLDGYGKVYNDVKAYVCPEKWYFEKIVDNIKLLNQTGIQIGIRLNYDTRNYEELKELIEYMHNECKELNGITYYVYPLWSCLNEKERDKFISSTQADHLYVELIKLLVDKKMCTLNKALRISYKRNQCMSCSKYSFSVFPNGKLGKCSETFKQTIGDVWVGIEDEKIYDFWTQVDIDDKCKECKYLPFCQGGCRSSYFTDMPKCYVNKPVLDELLYMYVDFIEKYSAN